MSNSRLSRARPHVLRSRGRKGPAWTMPRVRDVLSQDPSPEKHAYRDSAYHWLLDRAERQEATKADLAVIQGIFTEAERSGDLADREKVRGRFERIFESA